MKNQILVIEDYSAISPIGDSKSSDLTGYFDSRTFISQDQIDGSKTAVARLPLQIETEIAAIVKEPTYSKLDRSVHLALYAARQACKKIPLADFKQILVNIGSSRGATSLFESYIKQYLEQGQVAVQTSPTTTLGNISSWIAQDLNLQAHCLSTSVTCSTAAQSVLNGIAWLKSGMADLAIVGASEAALTGFTLAQMKALRIYANNPELAYPCQPCAEEYAMGAGMVLGEGAGIFVLRLENEETARANQKVTIEGYGFGREQVENATSISEEGDALYASMSMALKEIDRVDLVVMHAPGTARGDRSELNAIQKLFKNDLPILISNKWKLGHTFGAAGALNLDTAIQILKTQKFANYPYQARINNTSGKKIERILLNAAGFGGNAVSLVLKIAQ